MATIGALSGIYSTTNREENTEKGGRNQTGRGSRGYRGQHGKGWSNYKDQIKDMKGSNEAIMIRKRRKVLA